MESKPTEGESLSEEGMTEGEAGPEEWSVGEGEPIPEAKSIESKSIANKSIAVEREGTGPHEAAPHEASGARKGAPTKAATSERGPSKSATARAAAKSRRTQSRGTRGNRCNGQTNHYLAHYDAPPFCQETHPSLWVANCTVLFELQCAAHLRVFRLWNQRCKDQSGDAPRVANGPVRKSFLAECLREQSPGTFVPCRNVRLLATPLIDGCPESSGRIAQIDSAVEKATDRGRTTVAMKLADQQRKPGPDGTGRPAHRGERARRPSS